ncbi:MAG: helix-hairpin-helix domain-containing protein [Clostridiales bacterium]|nr:helix-hairpin-helix domain-containing protein [Clostridiales bacterium]
MSDLRTIPGVGKEMEKDLISLGYTTVESLKGANPGEMYDRLCALTGSRQDRCVLYVFRCAVYFAETENPEPEKLKWWNHKLI